MQKVKHLAKTYRKQIKWLFYLNQIWGILGNLGLASEPQLQRQLVYASWLVVWFPDIAPNAPDAQNRALK